MYRRSANWTPTGARPGQDRSRQGNGRRNYKFEQFKNVEVALEHGKVTSIVVYLAKPLDVEKARTRFAPGGLHPVEITDELGEPLGLAYPERGVAFSYATGTRDVARVLFEPIDEESFLLRAQTNWRSEPRRSLADAQFVVSRKADHAVAHWCVAQIYHEAGQLSDASRAIENALKSPAGQRRVFADQVPDSGRERRLQCRQADLPERARLGNRRARRAVPKPGPRLCARWAI